MCTRVDQKTILVVNLQGLTPCFLRQDLLLHQDSTDLFRMIGRQTLGSYWLLPQSWHCRFFMWALVVVLLSHLSPQSSLSHALCFDMDLRLLTARDISIEGNDFVH